MEIRGRCAYFEENLIQVLQKIPGYFCGLPSAISQDIFCAVITATDIADDLMTVLTFEM
jgi:hypothetical protein